MAKNDHFFMVVTIVFTSNKKAFCAETELFRSIKYKCLFMLSYFDFFCLAELYLSIAPTKFTAHHGETGGKERRGIRNGA